MRRSPSIFGLCLRGCTPDTALLGISHPRETSESNQCQGTGPGSSPGEGSCWLLEHLVVTGILAPCAHGGSSVHQPEDGTEPGALALTHGHARGTGWDSHPSDSLFKLCFKSDF